MKKKHNKKPVYQKPKIIRIKLDPAQAMFQQCSVGGIYFETTPTGCAYAAPGTNTTRNSCNTAVRGNSRYTNPTGFNMPTVSPDTQPS